MDKSPDAFRTISEVADWLGVQAHVLRFWESKFTQVKPVKRAGGRRYYRPADMQLLGGIKKLLHDDGLTIKGVQKILREQGVAHVSSLALSLEDSASPAPSPAEADTAVLPFRGQSAKARKARRKDPTPIDVELEPAPDVTADPAPDTPQPAPDMAVTASADPAPETDPGPEPAPSGPEPAPPAEMSPDVASVLPSFLHRPAPPRPAPTPAPEPAAAPRAVQVEAPDPPDDSDLPYTPGLLTRLAGLEALTAEQARAIQPLAKELRHWADRVGNA